jgi:hypothetical protein
MIRRSGLLAAILSFGATILIAQASPEVVAAETFGPGDQELYIGAAAFRPTADDHEYRTYSDGYIYRSDYGAWGDPPVQFVAPLRLPTGARIHQICLYGFNQSSPGAVSMHLDAVKLPWAGAPPGVVAIPGSAIPFTWTFGHGVVCSQPTFSYTYRESGDVDGDGNIEHLAHQLKVTVPWTGNGVDTRFGGAGIFWRRQVSPAPSAASFGDVPVGHPMFQFVEALVASGITAGCGGGNFCPDQPLTRGQMAVFLSVALGLHWPY